MACTTPKGEKVDQYTLLKIKGMEVKSSLLEVLFLHKVPNKKEKSIRSGNRIQFLEPIHEDSYLFGLSLDDLETELRKGKFTLDGKSILTTINNAPNALHGGPEGFHRVGLPEAKSGDSAALKLKYVSKEIWKKFIRNLTVCNLHFG
jgi:aldose 1-epimerase